MCRLRSTTARLRMAQWRGVMQPVWKADSAAAAWGQLPVVVPARQRTDLTELSVLAVMEVERLYREKYKLSGYGRLATDVIWLCKAWARLGLPVALSAAVVQAGGKAAGGGGAAAAAAAAAAASEVQMLAAAGFSSSSVPAVGDAGSAAAPFKGPPAYMWEVLVLYVLQQHAAAGTFYDQSVPLALFMAVLQAASTLLRTGDAEEALQRAIILVTSLVYRDGYTREQALRFSRSWGSERLYTPYVVHPLDPTYNCTGSQHFRGWDALAQAAGQLHAGASDWGCRRWW